jgi:hypothetical protein
MIDFIKDILGINKYHVAWEISIGGHVMRGSTSKYGRDWEMRYFQAKYIADTANVTSPTGRYWIERATPLNRTDVREEA